ncbi:MAG: ATP-binding protein [Acidobacteria bacterium]|nr:ATP-binding protein [Acidobacteriota bacterium]
MIVAEGEFRRALDSLEALFAFTAGFYAEQAIEPAHRFALDLALEELFTNIVKYNPRGAPVQVRLERDGNRVTVQLVDDDAAPFDVRRAPPARVDAPLAEREPGGLGLHLVRRLADRVDYEHQGRRSTIRVQRTIDPGPEGPDQVTG